MNWSKLPPLNALRAFSAVASAGSFVDAARQLAVTQAAVSQQVKALEERLGVPLVKRSGRGIQLTPEGARLGRDLASGFDIVARGVEKLQDEARARPVQVTMSPAFAVEWLLPKLGEFQKLHPEITLLLNPTSKLIELEPGGIDVAIRYRDRRRIVPDSDVILLTDMLVIGASSLIRGAKYPNPASLAELPWLQELGTNEASDWFTFHGVIPDRQLTVNHMPGNLIMSAVRKGDGITYTARAFFQPEIDSGQMVELFSEPLFGVYHLETRENLGRDARLFVRWLRSQAQTVTRGN